MSNALNSAQKLGAIGILGYLARLRHITAVGKAVEHGVTLVKEFLENTDDSTKLTVGIHHKNVALAFLNGCSEFNPLKLTGECSMQEKDQAVQDFKKPEHRLLICNILAGGTGVDGLQEACANAMVFERQWNFSKEKQFEDRFHRSGQTQKVVIDYVIASGTIDQFFAELVEEKRKICNETMGDYDPESDEQFLRDLANRAIGSRL
jgi:hypothetical protein